MRFALAALITGAFVTGSAGAALARTVLYEYTGNQLTSDSASPTPNHVANIDAYAFSFALDYDFFGATDPYYIRNLYRLFIEYSSGEVKNIRMRSDRSGLETFVSTDENIQDALTSLNLKGTLLDNEAVEDDWFTFEIGFNSNRRLAYWAYEFDSGEFWGFSNRNRDLFGTNRDLNAPNSGYSTAFPGSWSPSQVPLPATGLLLVAALGSIGGLSWHRKQKAAAGSQVVPA